MSLVDMCRLCMASENLVWIFDTRFESSENMKDVIYITTGVEIADTDIITQKICKKCCQVTIKMFEFRRTSLKNDQYLREKSRQILTKDIMKIPNTEVTIKACAKTVSAETGPEGNKQLKPVYKIHPSVRELFKVYPQIKLPTVCLRSHITPEVCMELDAVETYFRIRKLNMTEYTKVALRTGKVATKRTSAPAKPRTSQPSSSNTSPACEIKDPRQIKRRIGPASKVAERSSQHKKLDEIATQNKHTPPKTANQSKITPPHVKTKTSVRDRSAEKILIPKASSSRDLSPETTPALKKIKLSRDCETPKKEIPKLNVIESLGLVAKPACTGSPNTLSYVANTSVPLHICSICNSVQYSAKDLRKHQQKHLRCQFCKRKCKSLQHKRIHIDRDCVIKSTMNNLPTIHLDKIEFNLEIRRQFPFAFLDFPAIDGMHEKESSNSGRDDDLISVHLSSDSENVRSEELPSAAQKVPTSKPKQPPPKPPAIEIIEIVSDDEDAAPTSSDNVCESKPNEIPLADNREDSKLSVPHVPVEENVVYSTVSIVKPDIKIKGITILDNIDPKASDVRVLRELFTMYKPVQLLADQRVQTEFPNNRCITVNRTEMAAELTSLKQHLYAYKVPVLIKKGCFNVTYSFSRERKRQKKLSLWNDLTPIDLKRTSLPVSNSAQVNVPSATSVPVSNNVLNSATPNLSVARSATLNLPVSTSASLNAPILRNTNVSLAGFQSASVNLPLSSRATMNLPPMSSSANANLPLTSGIVNRPLSSGGNVVLSMASSNATSLPVSSCLNSVRSQNGVVQTSSVVILSSTASASSYMFTTASANPTFSNSVPPATAIANPMLNNFLDMQKAAAPVVLAASPAATASHADNNNGLPVGVIRVKDVSELT